MTTPRFAPDGATFHIVNRGVERRQLFFSDHDYQEFFRLWRKGQEKFPGTTTFAICAMPNHFHAVMRQDAPGAISRFMHWVTGLYALHVREVTNTLGLGHVFQRRFWSCPIETAGDYYCLMRYVEANAFSAGLVARAEDWRWSSCYTRRVEGDTLIAESLHPLPDQWLDMLNTPTDRAATKARYRKRIGRPSVV